jgi:hypothetical protein
MLALSSGLKVCSEIDLVMEGGYKAGSHEAQGERLQEGTCITALPAGFRGQMS